MSLPFTRGNELVIGFLCSGPTNGIPANDQPPYQWGDYRNSSTYKLGDLLKPSMARPQQANSHADTERMSLREFNNRIISSLDYLLGRPYVSNAGADYIGPGRNLHVNVMKSG